MINYLKILIIILIEFCSISIMMYYESYKKRFELKNKKKILYIIKICKFIFIVLLIIVTINTIIQYYNTHKIVERNNLNVNEIELKINEEYLYYENVKNNYNENILDPYIPEKFQYVEGNYDNGFVIEDELKNQYVWVPCSKEKNHLKKSNYSKNPFVSYDECYEEEYEEFINSVLKYGGFYISRYEIGKENNNPVSRKNVEIWNNINLEEAKQIVNSMYGEIDFKCEIINGFAYDTTLNWILKNDKINFEEEIEQSSYTGKKSYKNIYDILDENFELTLEKSYSNTIIYRGFLKTELEIKNTIGMEKTDNRWITEENSKIENLGIRTIIYK